MFQWDNLGRWLILLGLGIAALGVLLLIIGKVPLLNWWGRLPGDIRYESENGRVSCFVPIVSSLLLSLLLTIIVNVIVRLLNR